MDRLALLVPSRGRPRNAERLIEAMDKTCRADTRLVLGVDFDDPTLDDYPDPGELVVREGLRGRLVEWLNLLSAGREERFIGHIGDDNVPLSDGWDVRVCESLERNLFCFGDDLDPGRAPGSLSIHIFMRSWAVDKLGYMGPPSIQHMYVDPVWYAWGSRTSIEYLPDAVLQHLHYSLGHAPMDESYQHSTGLIPQDCARYNQYCRDGLNDDIAKLGGRPFTDGELAEFNRALNIPEAWPA